MIRLSTEDMDRTFPPPEDEFPGPLRTGARCIRALFHVRWSNKIGGSIVSIDRVDTGYWWMPKGAHVQDAPVRYPILLLDGPAYYGAKHIVVGWTRLPDVLFDPQSDDEEKFLKGAVA